MSEVSRLDHAVVGTQHHHALTEAETTTSINQRAASNISLTDVYDVTLLRFTPLRSVMELRFARHERG